MNLTAEVDPHSSICMMTLSFLVTGRFCSSGPDRGRLSSLFLLYFGGPANGHAARPGHAEETPGLSLFCVITACYNILYQGTEL